MAICLGLAPLFAGVALGILLARWLASRAPNASTAQPPPVQSARLRGACGIAGCPNMRPHSHVLDLVRRLRQRP
jgi:hypothetical protein